MVRFTVLASGSKGNSSIVSSCPTGDGHCTKILIDAGLSCRELFRRMRLVGEDPATLDAILITHEHQDHINGLAATARKLGIPVYFTEATHRAWVRQVTPKKRVTYAEWAEQYRAGKQQASGIPIPHPSPNPLPDRLQIRRLSQIRFPIRCQWSRKVPRKGFALLHLHPVPTKKAAIRRSSPRPVTSA